MKRKTTYICAVCGVTTSQWQGQCSSCREWNTLEAGVVDAKRTTALSRSGGSRPMRLEDVAEESTRTVSTGEPDVDAVLGKGLVPGSAVLFAGEPGIGKSTLLLQLAASMVRTGAGAVYVSGEESLGQLRSRAERLGILGPGLEALGTNAMEDVLAVLNDKHAPELLVVDSVQTMTSTEAEGIPGSVGQVRAVATTLVEAVKKTGTTLVLVGHVTKEGLIAGPKLLEHMVDTVLSMEGDKQHLFRLLRVVKNRFGPAGEVLVMQMKEKGLDIVHDPSTFFLETQDLATSGAAMAMTMDGQRPFVVEVQALASESYLAIPRRTALGFDTARLNLLLAVMSRQLKLNLSQLDIYTKIGAGLKLQDPGIDLAIVAAVLSSLSDKPVPPGHVFWGEVDLNGRIRPVFREETRLKQALKLGYTPICRTCSGKKASRIVSIAELRARFFA